ncbi:MAG: hypothetical protein IJS07_03265 [Bacteroidales bacterium]|nr:hypothetical protein [Bacteroidales bacterium]
MKNRKGYILLLAAVAILMGTAISCKEKEDKETVYEVFDGTLKFDVPAYVAPGDFILLTPSGVKRNSSDELTTAPGYYWSISPTATGKDTTRYENSSDAVTGAKPFTVPDTLCTLTISCVAFAKGYQAATATAYPTVVKPTIFKFFSNDIGSVDYSNYGFANLTTDSRDGKLYPHAAHSQYPAHLNWMQINLAYGGSGHPYADCPAMKDVFGHYYTWEEAQTACPPGWHLPTKADWASLAQFMSPEGYTDEDSVFKGLAGKLMDDVSFNGEKMWTHSADNRITNDFYFYAIPAGYAYKKGSGFYYAGAFNYAAYWVAEEYDPTHGQYRYIYYDSPDVYLGIADKKSFAATVRCVQ